MRCRIPEADLGQKLHDTVCRYKGQPVWIKVRDGEIHGYELPGAGKLIGRIMKDDVDFDISNVPLGYVNSANRGEKVYYLTRIPVRRTKQGLSNQNLKLNSLPKLPFNGKLAGATSILISNGFVDMVNNSYPQLEDAMKLLRKNLVEHGIEGQIAIRRDIALSIDKAGIVFVYYKNDYIGWIQPDKFIVHVISNGVSWIVSKYLSHVLGWEID